MSHEHRVVLSTGDFSLLESARVAGQREHLPELSRKLDAAVVTFPADIPPDVVTTGRTVTYRIGGGPAADRTISVHSTGPAHIPLLSPLGVALIGLSSGYSVAADLGDGELAMLTVERVHGADVIVGTEASLEQESRVLPFQSRKPSCSPAARPDNDPGPSAA